MGEARKNQFLVIDDDRDFCKFIKFVAANEFTRLEVVTASEASELGSLGRLRDYDLVILDYYLDEMAAEDICSYIESNCPTVPVVLISGETYILKEDLHSPRCVRSFVSKVCGVRNILNTALNIVLKQQGKVSADKAKAMADGKTIH